MLGTPGTEQHRTRVGFLFLMLGLLLVFWSWGSWIYRASVPVQAQAMVEAQTVGGEGAPTGNGTIGDRAEVARTMWLVLLVGSGLVLLVLFGTYAIVRALRRYRVVLESDGPRNTQAADVWSMHRLPPDDDDDTREPNEIS